MAPTARSLVRWFRRRRLILYRWAHIVLPAALLACAVALRFSGITLVEEVQLKSFDEFQRLKPRPYEDAGVRIIDIDDESLARIGQWPWPRTTVARLVKRLSRAGAAAIAFDVVFAEPDRTSPTELAKLPEYAAQAPYFRGLENHDAALAKAFASGPVVAGFSLTRIPNGVSPQAKVPLPAEMIPRGTVEDFPGAVVNLPMLERSAAGNGMFNYVGDRDGLIRRIPLLFQRGKDLVPSLSAETLRVAQGARSYNIFFGKRTAGGSELAIGRMKVPVDPYMQFWVYYTGPAPERTIPAWKVLDKNFDPASVSGCATLVGTSALGLKDLKPTPLHPAMPGVEIHATALEQMLLQRFLRRPDWADGAERLYMVLAGLLLLLLLARLGAAWTAPAAAAAIGGAIWFSWHSFTSRGYLIDPVFPSLALLTVYMASSLIGYLKSEAERRQVKTAFGRYMSPTLVEQLARHPEKLKLGGEMRVMTFHFCDIRGFTTISEGFDPPGLTQFINRFLTPMTEIVLKHRGVIDKYMGDCIMAFWNAPLEDPEHARNACRAALEMHQALAVLNEEWRREAEAAGRRFVPIHIGTGLNTGPCIVGNMGSDLRFDYSVLGDDVNLASRLEGQSKTYGVNVVIGPRTRQEAPEFAALELDLIKVKGKTVPVRIHALLGDAEVRAGSDFKQLEPLHERMLEAYRARRWDDAMRYMEECRASPFPLKILYDLYQDRVEVHRAAPPKPDWDGTYTATSK